MVWHDGIEYALGWASEDLDSSWGFATRHLDAKSWVQFLHQLKKGSGKIISKLPSYSHEPLLKGKFLA